MPAKVQSGYQNYHSLYLRKRDSWTQTNVALHIQTVRDSGRIREILLAGSRIRGNPDRVARG